MDSDEFNLALMFLYNAASSGSASPAPAQLPQVVPRPISKRTGNKRSSRACATCRARKVRCNVVAHGAPCSNCRHDEIECILPLSKRQRSARERVGASIQASTTGSEAGNPCNPSAEVENYSSAYLHDGMSRIQAWSKTQSVSNSQSLGPHGMPIQDYVLAEILPANSTNPLQEYSASAPPISSRTIPWIQIRSLLDSAPVKSTLSPREVLVPILPKIFTPFPPHVDPLDLSYLHIRNALTLPNEAMQIELLKAYIEFVHGSMPLLDLEQFLSAMKYGCEGLDGYNGKRIERDIAERKEISILLFQAVMFAAVGFVSMRVLKEAGYSSRESAKRIFFSRVRVLYDFDICTDRLSIIQSLLLMTLWPTNLSGKDGKDAWHWLGLAISLSYSLGLNRTIPSTNASLRRKRLERRVWWTAFVRDRALALSASGTYERLVRIKREDCDVRMLSLEDFDLDENERMDEGEEKIRLRKNAAQCVEKALLCWCSNDGLVGEA